ncbi:MAG: hypothetical protein AAFY99_08785 [Pseudomonadota bacterium]
MDPVLIFLLIGVGIIVLALFIGRFFNRTVNKQMPGQRSGTGIGIDVAHGAKAKGWMDKNDGGSFDAGGGGD